MASTAELMVNNLCVQFGGLKAVDEVSFALKEQTLAGLIGPNGARQAHHLQPPWRVFSL